MDHPLRWRAPASRPAADLPAERQRQAMADDAAPMLQVEAEMPEITPARGLTGWHREFCVELLGDGRARVFVRAVLQSSLRATELQQAVLFRRLDVRFTDLPGCVQALRHELERLAATARRAVASKDNLFITLSYDHDAWERIEQGVDQWARR